MTLDVPDEMLEKLGAAIARHLKPAPDMALLSIKELSKETGLSEDTLKNACRAYEHGSENGLRCTRDTPGNTNSPLRISRSWYLEWRERSADRSQVKHPIRLGRAAA